MKKEQIIAAIAALVLLVGMAACGGNEQEATADKAAAEQPASEHPVSEHPGTEVAEAHDCDGGCGMKAVPMDKLTEINGKYYCAGCAKKAQDEAGEGEDSHEGHNHG